MCPLLVDGSFITAGIAALASFYETQINHLAKNKFAVCDRPIVYLLVASYRRRSINLVVLNISLTGSPSQWDVIYKTLYESLTRFRKLLENGPK